MSIEVQIRCEKCGSVARKSHQVVQSLLAKSHSFSLCDRCRDIWTQESRVHPVATVPLLRQACQDGPGSSQLVAATRGVVGDPEYLPPQLDESVFGITNDKLLQLYKILADDACQALIVVSPTGSGKSTFLPYRLLVPPGEIGDSKSFANRGQIVVTQPRIQAARGISKYVGGVMNGGSIGPGLDVGFQHGGCNASDWDTRLVYVTDGKLINWIARGDLDKISMIVIDEAHERSLNIDLIISLVTRVLPRYPHLKLLIVSATIDHVKFQEFFERHLGGRARVETIEFSGRCFEVDKHFRDPAKSLNYDLESFSQLAGDLPEHVAAQVETLLRRMHDPKAESPGDEGGLLSEKRGDIVAFLQGAAPINKAVEFVTQKASSIHGLTNLSVLPLYTDLPQSAQDKALAKPHSTHEDVIEEIVRLAKASSKHRCDFAVIYNNIGRFPEILDAAKQRLASDSTANYRICSRYFGTDERPQQPIIDPSDDYSRILLTTDAASRYKPWPGKWKKIRFDDPERRVIITTNVAETSLTIHGILHVVESGVINLSDWDYEAQLRQIGPRIHSQAGCRQRWGRAGRIQPGDAWCLYTEKEFNNSDIFPTDTTPEIQRSRLEELVLKSKTAGVDSLNPASFPWVDAPHQGELLRCETALVRMGALDDEGDLTAFGEELNSFRGDFADAELMMMADQFTCAVEMSVVLPMMELMKNNSLFFTDKDWTTAQRRRAKQVQESLASSCVDDLEFALKIFDAWSDARQGRRGDIVHCEAWSVCWNARIPATPKVKGNSTENQRLVQLVDDVRKATSQRELNQLRRQITSQQKLSKQWLTWLDQACNEFKEALADAWATAYYVRGDLLRDEILPKHEGLLGSLARGMRGKEFRNINFQSLDKLRMLLCRSRPQDCFELTRDTRNDDQSFGYKPLLEENAAVLNRECEVQWTRNSICKSRAPFSFFCGNRKRMSFERFESGTGNVSIETLQASFIVKIDSAISNDVQQTDRWQLTKLLASVKKPVSQSSNVWTDRQRIMVDQILPIGTRLDCQFDSHTKLGNVIGVIPETTFANRATVQLRDQLKASRHRKPAKVGGVKKGGLSSTKHVVVPKTSKTYQASDVLIDQSEGWANIDEETMEVTNEVGGNVAVDEQLGSPTEAVQMQCEELAWVKVVEQFASQNVTTADGTYCCQGVVVGYRFNRDRTCIVVIAVDQVDAFAEFKSVYDAGKQVSLEVVSSGETQAVEGMLLVRETKSSQLVMSMRSEDLCFDPSLDVTESYQAGDRFQATVIEVGDTIDEIRLSVLPNVDGKIESVVADLCSEIHQGKVVEVNQHAITLLLRSPKVPGVRISARMDVPKKHSFQPGDSVSCKPGQRKSFRTGLQAIPAGVRLSAGLRQETPSPPGRYAVSLVSDGRLSWKQLLKLQSASDDASWHQAVNRLYQFSNTLRAKVAYRDLDKRHPVGAERVLTLENDNHVRWYGGLEDGITGTLEKMRIPATIQPERGIEVVGKVVGHDIDKQQILIAANRTYVTWIKASGRECGFLFSRGRALLLAVQEKQHVELNVDPDKGLITIYGQSHSALIRARNQIRGEATTVCSATVQTIGLNIGEFKGHYGSSVKDLESRTGTNVTCDDSGTIEIRSPSVAALSKCLHELDRSCSCNSITVQWPQMCKFKTWTPQTKPQLAVQKYSQVAAPTKVQTPSVPLGLRLRGFARLLRGCLPGLLIVAAWLSPEYRIALLVVAISAHLVFARTRTSAFSGTLASVAFLLLIASEFERHAVKLAVECGGVALKIIDAVIAHFRTEGILPESALVSPEPEHYWGMIAIVLIIGHVIWLRVAGWNSDRPQALSTPSSHWRNKEFRKTIEDSKLVVDEAAWFAASGNVPTRSAEVAPSTPAPRTVTSYDSVLRFHPFSRESDWLFLFKQEPIRIVICSLIFLGVLLGLGILEAKQVWATLDTYLIAIPVSIAGWLALMVISHPNRKENIQGIAGLAFFVAIVAGGAYWYRPEKVSDAFKSAKGFIQESWVSTHEFVHNKSLGIESSDDKTEGELIEF